MSILSITPVSAELLKEKDSATFAKSFPHVEVIRTG